MSDLHERLLEAAEAAARQGRTRGPVAAVRRGRQRRRRLIAGTASMVVLVLLAGTLGVDRLTSHQTPLAPAPTTSPPTTSAAPTPRSVTAFTPLEVEVHVGPFQGSDRARMVSDVTSVMEQCGGTAEVLAWAQTFGKTWLLAVKPPPPGKNWMCWSDGLFEENGAGMAGWHGGPSDRLDPLQASKLSDTIRGKGELAVVSGPVTKQAVRLRILPRKGRPLELVPFDAGPRFPVNFYAGFYLQPKKTAWRPERVVAYDKTGRRIAECWATTHSGNVCDRPQGAPQPP